MSATRLAQVKHDVVPRCENSPGKRLGVLEKKNHAGFANYVVNSSPIRKHPNMKYDSTHKVVNFDVVKGYVTRLASRAHTTMHSQKRTKQAGGTYVVHLTNCMACRSTRPNAQHAHGFGLPKRMQQNRT